MTKSLNRVRNIILALALGVVLATGVRAVVHAAPGDTPTCKYIPQADLGKGFTKGSNSKGDTISTTVGVQGDSNCRKDFVLASFIVPHQGGNPYPLEDQKLFASATLQNVASGPNGMMATYSLTVNVPKCFYQVDLALGTNPTGPGGHLPYEPGRLLNAYLGGQGLDCGTKPPPPSTGACSSLDVAFVNKENRTVSAKVNGTGTNIIGYKIVWGDGTSDNAQTKNHKYGTEKDTFTITGMVQVKQADGSTVWKDGRQCQRVVNFKTKTITPPTVTTVSTSTPTATPSSTTTELTNTGAGDAIGMFTATAIGAALWHKFYFLRKFARR